MFIIGTRFYNMVVKLSKKYIGDEVGMLTIRVRNVNEQKKACVDITNGLVMASHGTTFIQHIVVKHIPDKYFNWPRRPVSQ